jgi:Myristoyl-CoA:protein N-myristoyltransferase, C-terminal domain
VKQLLDGYLAQYSLAPVMSEADLAHALLPSDDVVSSYVVEAEGVHCECGVVAFTLYLCCNSP